MISQWPTFVGDLDRPFWDEVFSNYRGTWI